MKDLFYLQNNADIPFSCPTSTARKGDKWAKQVKPGDMLRLVITETNQPFGYAIACAALETNYRNIIHNAHANHVVAGKRVLEGGEEPAKVLADELNAAYGPSNPEDVFTALAFIRLSDEQIAEACAQVTYDKVPV